MNSIEYIIKYLNELFPDPKCELVYNNDYELLIAVVLSAQTTDKKVNKVTYVLFNKYPSLTALKEAPINDLRALLKPLGMYNKKALFVKHLASELIDKYDGVVPDDRASLESLSGVGRKTANVVLAVLFNKPYIAVDTHVARVSKRLGLVSKQDNTLQIEKTLSRLIDDNSLAKAHLQLVLFGRYYCMAKKPRCINCKLKKICKYEKKHFI